MRLVIDTNAVVSGLLFVPNDPDDDQVIAAAVEARADLIVSGDKDLHDLGGNYNGIRIVTPAQAVQLIAR